MRNWAYLWLMILPAAGSSVASAQGQIEPTFEGIQSAIQAYESSNPGYTLTIPDVLRRLPHLYRDSFALMHTSRSLQSASPRFPRVLLFGTDASTVIAFNGEHTQAGFDMLEFASVDPASGRLSFRFATFPAQDRPDGKVVFSDSNPSLCMSCHGPVPHFIWSEYLEWPGAYGEQDDTPGLSAGEAEKLKEFLAGQETHPRYKNLIRRFAAQSNVAPYRPRTGDRATSGGYNPAIEFRPNARLGMLLMRRQADDRVARAEAHAKFNQSKYGFAFYLSGCDQLNAAKAAQIGERLKVTSYREMGSALGLPGDEAWHLELGPSEAATQDFNAGLSTMRSAVLSTLWRKDLLNDVELKRFYAPIPVESLAREAPSYGLAFSPWGYEFFRTLETLGPILSGYAGAFEADTYAEGIGFKRGFSVQAACDAIAAAALSGRL